MSELFTWHRTCVRGFVRLDVYTTVCGRSYYRIWNTNWGRAGCILELEIQPDGRRFDYLALDRFWGHVTRPLDVPALPDLRGAQDG